MSENTGKSTMYLYEVGAWLKQLLFHQLFIL
jgi:hypothetical protein